MTATIPVRLAMQRTLRDPIDFAGVGVHTDNPVAMRLKPAPPDHGVVFRRTDIEGDGAFVRACFRNVDDTAYATTLRNRDGVEVRTVEHLLAALAGCGVDNVLVEVDRPELPIMDGSARLFVSEIEAVGTRRQDQPRRVLRILRPVTVEESDRRITAAPAGRFSVDLTIDFASPAIGRSRLDVGLCDFRTEISAARTFATIEEFEFMKRLGLANGGSPENAIVIKGGGVLNEGGLRYPDEFVRHKILDCIGDLYLAGGQIEGRITAYKSGHRLNNRLLRRLFSLPDAFEWVRLDGGLPPGGRPAASLAAD